MPNTPGTQPRQIRIPDADWQDFATAASVMGTERAGAVRAFIEWYVRRPGARLPKRPDQPTDTALADLEEDA